MWPGTWSYVTVLDSRASRQVQPKARLAVLRRMYPWFTPCEGQSVSSLRIRVAGSPLLRASADALRLSRAEEPGISCCLWVGHPVWLGWRGIDQAGIQRKGEKLVNRWKIETLTVLGGFLKCVLAALQVPRTPGEVLGCGVGEVLKGVPTGRTDHGLPLTPLCAVLCFIFQSPRSWHQYPPRSPSASRGL